MQRLFILFFLFISQISFSQKKVIEFNEQELGYFRTLLQTVSYFKVYTTTHLVFHKSETYSRIEAFYDTAIIKFFAKEKMMRLLEEDTSHFAVTGKVDWLRHTLNEFDYYLDIIPSDSIFVRPYKMVELPNALEVYLIVNNKDVSLYIFHFDPISDLLISISIGGIQEDRKFMEYLRRQKNYYEFPDPKRGVTINQ